MSAVGLEFTEFGGAGVRLFSGNGPTRFHVLTFEQPDPRDPTFLRAYPFLPSVAVAEDGAPGHALGAPALLAGSGSLRLPTEEEYMELLFRLVAGARVSLGAIESTALCVAGKADLPGVMGIPGIKSVSPEEALGHYAGLVAPGIEVSILYISSERVFAVHRRGDGVVESLLSDEETWLQPGLVQRALEDLHQGEAVPHLEAAALFGMARYSDGTDFSVRLGEQEVGGTALSRELRRQTRRASQVKHAVSVLPGHRILVCGPLVGGGPPAFAPTDLGALLGDREVVGNSRWSPRALSVGCAWASAKEGSQSP